MIAEPIEAPDFAEAIEAWRVWRVVRKKDGYTLGSVIKPTLWPVGQAFVAECLRTSALATWFRRKRGQAAPVPDADCECGIYAAWLPDIRHHLTDMPQASSVGRVLGQVSLWGTVIECERGFRAARAYPLRIYVPLDASLHSDCGWDDLVAGLEVYGVPVEPLPARCADAISLLEQRQLASLYETDG